MNRASSSTEPSPTPTPTPMLERWRTEAGPADVAVLTIPADARRARRFEIDCRFVVAAKADGARHGLRVEVDGAHEWSRESATANPGETDSLDVHFRRTVPVGKSLRIVAKTTAAGAQRVRLAIEAEEDRPE